MSEARAAELSETGARADASTLIAAAELAFPELEPTSILFSRRANQPAFVQGRNGNIFVRERSNGVFLDPVSADVVAVRRAHEIGWLRYLNQMADPLHFGYWAGLPTKLIWFLFGAGMTGLSVTGVWLTYIRLKPKALFRAQFATLPVLMGMMFAGYFWFERYQGP